MIAKMMASPYAAPALISGGTQIAGALISGAGQKAAIDEQKKLAEDAKVKYGANVGAILYPQYNSSGLAARYMQTPTGG
jgi:hypothetical protein